MSVRAENAAYVVTRYEDVARAAGLGRAWDHMAGQDDSPTRTMLLGIIGAFALGLLETGYAP